MTKAFASPGLTTSNETDESSRVTCVHIEGEGHFRGHTLPYRAHIALRGDGSSMAEVADGVFIEFDHDALQPVADAALHGITANEERTLNDTLAEAAVARYMMKRLKGEAIDEETRPGEPGNAERRRRLA